MIVDILPFLTIGVLFMALFVFLLALIDNYLNSQTIKGNYNFYFSLFLFGWVAIELVQHYYQPANEILASILHLLVLLVLAIWMNLRFSWALRTAGKETEVNS